MRPHLPLGVWLLIVVLALPWPAPAADETAVAPPAAPVASPSGPASAGALAGDISRVIGRVSSLAPQALVLSLAQTAPVRQADRAVLAVLWSPPAVSAAVIERFRKSPQPGAEQAAAELSAFVEQRRPQIEAQRAEIASQIPELRRLALPQSAEELFDGTAKRNSSEEAVVASSEGSTPESARLAPADKRGALRTGLTPAALVKLRQDMLDVEDEKRAAASRGWRAFLPRRRLLKKADMARLTRTLALIDAHFVDPIPAQAWNETLAALAHVARHAFRPDRKNWPGVVTLMLREATRRLPDLYSNYLDAKSSRASEDRLNHRFVGVGIIYSTGNDSFGTITEIVPGGPADRAGLRVGDVLVSLNGVGLSPENLSTIGDLKGEAGTSIKLGVRRDGKLLKEMRVVRAFIKRPNVVSKLLTPQVGYIFLASFSSDAPADVLAQIRSLRSQGARKLIFDLRYNPGGAVAAEQEIVSAFAKEGDVIEIEQGRRSSSELRAQRTGEFAGMPLVILVNRGSASASENLAGTLQDAGVPVVGNRTSGKGTTTWFIADEEGNTLRLTAARWYTPKGRNFSAQRNPAAHRKVKLEGTGGLVPDYEVAVSPEEEKIILDQMRADLAAGKPLVGRPRAPDPFIAKALQMLEDRAKGAENLP